MDEENEALADALARFGEAVEKFAAAFAIAVEKLVAFLELEEESKQ